MQRRTFLAASATALAVPHSMCSAQPKNTRLISSISKATLWSNRDGSTRTWFHPRACMLPNSNGQPVALMTLQEIGGSDYFGPVQWSLSRDQGQTWSEPEPIAALGRDPVPGRDDHLMAGVCDVTPQYHPQSDSVIAMGHVVFYKGDYFARKEQLARYPVYAVRSADGTWSERKILEWDDARGGHIYTNNCGQRVVLPDGTVQMSFTFGPEEHNRMVAGVRATFDGNELKIQDVGPPIHNPKGRGLLEPSVTQFRDRFWITMRAEDSRGYLSTSDDGLNWESKRAWCWQDGTPLEMSTTQQHWLTHSDGLLLVYTRKDETNSNVIRWRSPLWVAQVDPESRCLIRETEQVVLPLVGDGVNEPDKVALMGNFNVTNVSAEESWVTVGEWMPRNGYRGDVLLARIHWSTPNRQPLW
ncbi:MAG: sialidase family protein [Planctomycetaceae bacterium]